MSSTLKRRKKLLLVTMTCILAEKHLRKKKGPAGHAGGLNGVQCWVFLTLLFLNSCAKIQQSSDPCLEWI